MWFVWLALLIDAPVAGVITPLGWQMLCWLAVVVLVLMVVPEIVHELRRTCR